MDVTINKQARDVMADKDEILKQVKAEKPVKAKILTLPVIIIGFLVIVFGAFMIYGMTHQHVTSKSNSSQTASTKAQSSSSSSKYVAGKDYKITYSNQGIIDRATLDKGLSENGLNDIDDLMDTNKQTGANMAKIEVYYNKDKNLLVERLFENGYQDDQETTRVVYDISKGEIPDNGATPSLHYQGYPLVYKWEKLTR